MLLKSNSFSDSIPYHLSLNNLIYKQQQKIKSPIVDMDNWYNKVFPSFNSFNKEFIPSHRLIDIFSNRFSFHITRKWYENSLKEYIWSLNNIALNSSLDPSSVLIVTDTSIKNYITMSISHTHIHNKQMVKTIHHAINVITAKAKLFAIRCDINQATNL